MEGPMEGPLLGPVIRPFYCCRAVCWYWSAPSLGGLWGHKPVCCLKPTHSSHARQGNELPWTRGQLSGMKARLIDDMPKLCCWKACLFQAPSLMMNCPSLCVYYRSRACFICLHSTVIFRAVFGNLNVNYLQNGFLDAIFTHKQSKIKKENLLTAQDNDVSGQNSHFQYEHIAQSIKLLHKSRAVMKVHTHSPPNTPERKQGLQSDRCWIRK